MKEILAIALTAIALYAVYKIRVETAQKFANKQIERVEIKSERIREQAKEQAEIKHLAEKVKVFVKAKDAKICMKELHTDTIDNSVVECNKDHFVEMTRSEAEEMKEQ